MLLRTIGSLAPSAVGLGTWAMGGWMWGGTDDEASIGAIRASLDAGVSLIDTAPIYGFGHCEEIVGKAIAGRRDEVVLATKCGMVWDREQGEFYFASDAEHPDPTSSDYRVYKCLDPASIRAEVERSLRRLGTDRIDLYQTHWQERTTRIEDSMAELLRLREEGKILEIGASNCTADDLRAYRRAGGIASTQEGFSLLDRSAELELVPEARRQGMAFIAYSALSMGLLTGKLSPDRVFEPGDQRSRRRRFSPEGRRRAQRALARLVPLARDKGVEIGGLVLARTLRVPGVTHVLCGARTPAQAVANARAGEIVLSGGELAAIDAVVDEIARPFARSSAA